MSGDGSANAPIEILPVGKGYAIAWSAPWGAAASIVTRFSASERQATVLLGSIERTRRSAPRLFHLEGGVGVAWCEDEGARVGMLAADGRSLAWSRLVVPGGRELALAAGRRVSHAFVADGESVRVVHIRSDGETAVAAQPLIEQHGRPLLCAARAGDAPLCLALFEGDRRLFVAHATRGRASLVRHDLDGAYRAIDAYGVGGRAVFAIASADGDTIEAGIVDLAGKMVERRDVLVREAGALFTDVRVTWIEDDFHVVARDARHDRARAVRLGTRAEVLSVPRVTGAFAVAYHEKRFVLAQASSGGDAAIVRLSACDQRGAGAQTIELVEPPPDAVRRQWAEARIERCIAELEAALGSAGYRDARATRVAVEGGAGVQVAAERQRLELRAAGERVVLTLAVLADGVVEPQRDGSFERMARWIRERSSGEARKKADAERAIGSELAAAIGGELLRVERNEAGLRLEIALGEPPDGARLSAWLHRAGATLNGPR